MKSLAEMLETRRAAGIFPTNLPISSYDDQSDNSSGREFDSESDSRSASGSARDERPRVLPTMSTQPTLPDGNRPNRSNVAFNREAPCAICGGVGYYMPDLPLGHPDFGKAMTCQCREQARLERRLRVLKNVGTLEMLDRLTFDNFIAEPTHLSPEKAHNLRRAYETCLRYAQDPDGWLLLTGTYGCGKTHLAASIANARLAMGEPVLFMVVPDLLDHLRSAFNPQSELRYDELFEQLRTTPLLILDDLGAQSSTAWAQEKLFQLLNHRYNAHLATVITTNQRLEDLEPRLRSRFLDVSLVNHFVIIASDFRSGGNPAQNDLSSLILHRDQNLDSFQVRRNNLAGEEQINLQRVYDACSTYADNPMGWLVLSGANGCGKTHLAAAIANYQVAHGQQDVMFIVVPDLLDHLRAAFSPTAATSYDRRFDEIKKIPLLVLDDLGTESATPWAREKLFQLLNYRYSALLATVITTSSEPQRMEPWLRTRLFDVSRCQFWEIIAPEYRSNRPQPPNRPATPKGTPKNVGGSRARNY